MVMTMKAPTTGPNTVPRPPSSVISTTSPDMLQLHVGERSELEDERFRRAGEAGERGGQQVGEQLVAIDRRSRARARACSFSRIALQHLAEGRVDGTVDDHEAGHEDHEYGAVHGPDVLQVDEAEQALPRGTAWMPSSPPVKAACR